MSASAYTYETVKVSFPAPFVAHVELNRPKKLNAINDTMWVEIGAVFNQLRDDEDVRAIVLSGAGRCFTSGLDCNFLAPFSTSLLSTSASLGSTSKLNIH